MPCVDEGGGVGCHPDAYVRVKERETGLCQEGQRKRGTGGEGVVRAMKTCAAIQQVLWVVGYIVCCACASARSERRRTRED